MTDNPIEIATAFVDAWAQAWNTGGPAEAIKLYTPDAVLVGAAMGVGQHDIERLMSILYKQGWTTVKIKVVNARVVGGLVLAACDFTAIGSGDKAGTELQGNSSHALTQIGGTWLSTMHSAA
ncbi:MAG TPA: nuclear transport factor 2 family protein [Magnetospirillaceae bacterium]|jgi:uncharacterized protein (TIGR02246 family)